MNQSRKLQSVPMPGPLDDLGQDIFLTWTADTKKLGNAVRLARLMREGGTTFRGCSFDVKVSHLERCPVCGRIGLNPSDLSWEVRDKEEREDWRSGWVFGAKKRRP